MTVDELIEALRELQYFGHGHRTVMSLDYLEPRPINAPVLASYLSADDPDGYLSEAVIV
jgi:hypothetical protein